MARKLGDFEGAAADFARALAAAPGSVRAHNSLAFCLARLGGFAEAVAAYDGALRLDPGNVHAWHNRWWRPCGACATLGASPTCSAPLIVARHGICT